MGDTQLATQVILDNLRWQLVADALNNRSSSRWALAAMVRSARRSRAADRSRLGQHLELDGQQRACIAATGLGVVSRALPNGFRREERRSSCSSWIRVGSCAITRRCQSRP